MYTPVIMVFSSTVLLLGILSLTPVIIQAQIDEPVSWKTFKDEEGLFTIKYPSNWNPIIIETDSSPPPIAEFWYGNSYSPGKYNNSFAYLTLIKWENDSRVTGTTASDRLESYSAAYKMHEDEPGYQVVRPVECSKYTLNGVQACSIIDSYTIPEVGKRFSMSVDATDASGVGYTIFYVASPDLFKPFFPAAQSMIKSFALTEDATSVTSSQIPSTLPDKFGLDKTQDIMLENGTSYPIKYKITGGQVSNMGLERPSGGAPSLIININTRPQDSDFGKLVVEIPNTVLDSNRKFIVYDGQVGGGNSPTESKKLASDSDSAIVEAEFWNGSSDGYPLSTIKILGAG